MTQPVLDIEQEQTLAFLVEASRKLPRDARRPFYGMRVMGTSYLLLNHPEVPRGHPGLYPGDIEELAAAGLVRLKVSAGNTWVFDVTPLGFRYYEQRRLVQGDAERAVQRETRDYLDSSGFKSRHSRAFEKWREAEDLLWGAESGQSLTVIGHNCREAMQLLATSLLDRHPCPTAPGDPAKTKARIAAVIGGLPAASATATEVTQQLVSYWDALIDLVQRQEHGALREGTPLAWEDARRVVFHTLFAMTEVDRLVQ